jgi:hypothetical protein
MIILAFGIIGLIAMVGFAIDGGRLYSIRRQAQNAADAAAIAGTRELAIMISNCAAGNVDQNYTVGGAVANFARNNGIQPNTATGDVKAWYVDENIARLTLVNTVGIADQSIPTGATGVEVATRITDTTTFLRFFGQKHIVGVGEATAITGPVVEFGGGVLPIGVPELVLDGLGSGEPFYVFDKDGVFCREHDDHCFGSESDPASQRGWLHLGHIFNAAHWESDDPMNRAYSSNFGAGTSDECSYHDDGTIDVVQTRMNAWAAGSCSYPYPIYRGEPGTLGGDFIAGLTGAKASGLKAVSRQIGNTVYLPVFDYVYQGEVKDDEIGMNTIFPGKEPDVGWVTGNSKIYYHIVGYVAVDLSDVSGGKIEGEFVEAVIGAGKIQPGGGIGSSCNALEIMGVKLWE